MDIGLSFQSYLSEFRYKHLALYHALRDAIVKGTLSTGTQLPSSRELAAQYQVSRGIVSQVYETLTAEGYVETRLGSGTFVSREREQRGGAEEAGTMGFRLSAWGERMDKLVLRSGDGVRAGAGVGVGAGAGTGVGVGANTGASASAVSFTIGLPDISRFPAEAWHRLVYTEAKRLTAEPRRDAFDAQGHRPLREAIAQYVRRARGIRAEAEDILICNGSMQAIALLAQALVSPGDAVVMECPGYGGIARAILAAGGVVLPGRVDACGIIPQAWPDARLLFATPSRQYPTGAVLPLERRQQLLRWAKQQQAVIVEDDYDSEFRWSGRPIEPLKALDRDGRVVYIATFSKTMLPDLRIGYCIMPPSLMGTLAKAKQLFEPHPTSLLEQRALAAFMSSGQYERHLRRMKTHYSRNHTFLRKLLETQLHDAFDIIPSDAGLHLFGWWKHSRSRYNEYKHACEQAGVHWSDAGNEEPIPEQVGVCFGFSHLEEEAMEQGITTMTTIWRTLN